MAAGQALTQGYNVGRQALRDRSLMPVINSMGQMIRDRRSRVGRRSTAVGRSAPSTGLDARAAEREARHQAEKMAQEEKYRYEREQSMREKEAEQAQELRAGEETRRQETHEQGMRRSEMETDIVGQAASREEKLYIRKEAYEQAKQGLMLKDAAMVEDAIKKLMPESGGGDTITYGETEGGARKITARPTQETEAPKFIFHPDGYVGVQFPGQDKPTVFKDEEEAFKRVLAPMSPERWSNKQARPQDQVTERKNVREAEFKDRKLRADVHGEAHEAAMKQFEADGYYQPSLYDEEKYWSFYNDYVQRATGTTPPPQKGRATPTDRGGQPNIYRGKERPEGFPGARQGPRGGWYIMKKGRWYPILEGKESSPETTEPGPGRRPPDTASQQPEIQASGISFSGSAQGRQQGGAPYEEPARGSQGGRTAMPKARERPRRGKIYRGKAQPPDYPDAQYDKGQKAWFYFDENEGWQKVRI